MDRSNEMAVRPDLLFLGVVPARVLRMRIIVSYAECEEHISRVAEERLVRLDALSDLDWGSVRGLETWIDNGEDICEQACEILDPVAQRRVPLDVGK
jgi:hypothetical protein